MLNPELYITDFHRKYYQAPDFDTWSSFFNMKVDEKNRLIRKIHFYTAFFYICSIHQLKHVFITISNHDISSPYLVYTKNPINIILDSSRAFDKIAF